MAVVEPPGLVEAARAAAEEDLLFSVFPQSMSAMAGTESYGPENVIGVGVTEREVAGQPTGEEAVAVYVSHKVPAAELDPGSVVPEEYEGVPTDVVEIGEIVAHTPVGRIRPAVSGVSLARYPDGAGTLGFVADKAGQPCIVSNNHVLADLNRAAVGDPVVQPGASDGGTTASDLLGEVGGWVDLDFGGSPVPVDAAWATVNTDVVTPDEIYAIGKFDPSPLEGKRKLLVRKSGRTTGVTRGVIDDDRATIKIRYSEGRAILNQQLVVKGIDGEPFSTFGDSGSLVIDEVTRRPVGLLCGGSSKRSIVNRIDQVLTALDVSFAT